jgi:hypothetical protein
MKILSEFVSLAKLKTVIMLVQCRCRGHEFSRRRRTICQNSELDLYPSFDNDYLISKLTALIYLIFSPLINTNVTYPMVEVSLVGQLHMCLCSTGSLIFEVLPMCFFTSYTSNSISPAYISWVSSYNILDKMQLTWDMKQLMIVIGLAL